MPKPVKKAVRKLKVPPKPKRPSDPNRAAQAILAEHMARVQSDSAGVPEPAVSPTFEEQFRAKMRELGRTGGKKSGAKRMENLSEKRRKQIAKLGAKARWARKGGGTGSVSV